MKSAAWNLNNRVGKVPFRVEAAAMSHLNILGMRMLNRKNGSVLFEKSCNFGLFRQRIDWNLLLEQGALSLDSFLAIS